MKLADISNGPDWILWVCFVIFLILSVVLLSGHGSSLIAGYNTASKEEKAKYNEKKLCRVVGSGMAFIAVLILGMGLLEHILPAYFAYVTLVLIVVDVVAIIVISNIACRK